MTEAKATREGYGDALLELGKSNNDVVVVDADLGDSTKAETFGKQFPDRYFTAGIAEQDMIGIAAGLAVSGKIPFASTFAIFSERAFEFVRNIVARNNLNVKIAGSHAGIFTGEDGKSAQAIEDIAIYRALPNMIVIQPSDYIETKKAVHALAKYRGSSFMRLLRNPLPMIHNDNYKFEIGKGEILRKGKDAVIFATGTMVHESLKAAEILKEDKIDVYVVNMHTIKPIDEKLIVDLAKKTNLVITAEDHNIIGGLGSAVAEVLSENYPCLMKRIGMEDRYGESGKPAELYEKYGLSANKVAEKVKAFVKKK
ncbi:transketolase [Candidatus Woesearchaeota archaeon]|nr:transketolase [Candidatus Woesearchaeota archaeon]|tara:strand:+ start:8411 stop:9346 length:936 start_codon:yes stop_codon:yes gene_type:complete